MNTQNEIRELLNTALEKSRLNNPNYSMRAFSRDLNISVAAISQILAGKREITLKMAHKILEGICANPESSQRLLSQLEDRKKSESDNQGYTNLNIDQFHVAGNWQYYAILSLAETKDFKSDPDWIAERLGISKTDAHQAVERLERLEMLVRDEDGELKTTGVQFTSGTGSENLTRRKHNLQNLELARAAINNTPLEKRDISHMTMAVDPARLPEAREMIKDFRRSLSAFMEGGEKKEVYKVAIQLFPLSK